MSCFFKQTYNQKSVAFLQMRNPNSQWWSVIKCIYSSTLVFLCATLYFYSTTFLADIVLFTLMHLHLKALVTFSGYNLPYSSCIKQS